MDAIFRALDLGDGGGQGWVDTIQEGWDLLAGATEPAARTPAGDTAARDYLAEYMPELLPVATRLAGDIDQPGAVGMLAMTALKPFFAGCSQVAVNGTLVRNYDFDPAQTSRVVHCSRFLRPVIGMGEALWGLLDGMNDAGLAVSLTFGGRLVSGPGFSVLIVARYLLETCATVEQAWGKLRRMPVALSQNLTLVDGQQAASVYLGPDRPARRIDDPFVTNHQEEAPAPEHDQSLSVRRRDAVRALVESVGHTPDPTEAVVTAMLQPPLHNAFGDSGCTVYTAAYRPAEGRVSFVWPGIRREQSFRRFVPETWSVTLPIPPSQ